MIFKDRFGKTTNYSLLHTVYYKTLSWKKNVNYYQRDLLSNRALVGLGRKEHGLGAKECLLT